MGELGKDWFLRHSSLCWMFPSQIRRVERQRQQELDDEEQAREDAEVLAAVRRQKWNLCGNERQLLPLPPQQ